MSEEESIINTETTEAPAEGGSDFMSSLPEEYRNDSSMKDITDVGGLAKGYINAQRMIGGSIRIPGEDSSDEAKSEFMQKLQTVDGVIKMPDESKPEEVNAFYSRLGVPEKPDMYSVEAEGMNQEAFAEFKTMAHEMHLTNDQVKNLVGYQQNEASKAEEAAQVDRQNADVLLKETWGNDYNNRMEAAKQAVSVYGEKHPEAVQSLVNGPAGNNPALLLMLADMGKNMIESGHAGTTAGGGFGKTATEAKDSISDIMGNPAHPYHSGDAQAIDKMQRLYKSAYPQ